MMITINVNILCMLVLIALHLQNKQVSCATIRGHILDGDNDNTNTNERQYHSSVQRRAKMKTKDDPEDRDAYGNGNYVEEYYPCVTVEELNAAGKKFLHPMEKGSPEQNGVLNGAGDLLPPESCSCNDGCCRTYQWLVCDTEGYLPYIPCICNQNTQPRPINANQGMVQVQMNPSPFAGATQPGSGFSLDRTIPIDPTVAANQNVVNQNENHFSMQGQSNPVTPTVATQAANSQQQSSSISESGSNGAGLFWLLTSP